MTLTEVAKKYIGKTEKPSNSGWYDAEFERRMKEVGWLMGQAWCSYFVELCFKEAYPDKYKKVQNLFDASAVKTFSKFKAGGFTISQVPVENSIVIWQHYSKGVAGWQGHASVCIKAIDAKTFKSIDGNTSGPSGNQREGFIVAEKTKTIKKVDNGLNLLGFIVL